MAKKAMNFKSKEAMRKWMAHGHIHGEFEKSPGNTPVKIQGKAHEVRHEKKEHHKKK